MIPPVWSTALYLSTYTQHLGTKFRQKKTEVMMLNETNLLPVAASGFDLQTTESSI